MLDVVCLKYGDLYDYHYVNRLYAGVRRHLSHDFRFRCITDNQWRLHQDIDVIDLPGGIPKWWGKVMAFDKQTFPNRTIVLDLDTVIVDSIDFLAEYEGKFAALNGFGMPWRLGSAVMSIAPDAYPNVWEAFRRFGPKSAEMFCGQWGDGHWMQLMIGQFDILQEMYPGKFVSFKWPLDGKKWHCQDGLPEGAAVVCFHGSPRPHELVDVEWMKEHWHGNEAEDGTESGTEAA